MKPSYIFRLQSLGTFDVNDVTISLCLLSTHATVSLITRTYIDE